MKTKHQKHFFHLKVNDLWLSWKLTKVERQALYQAFHHYKAVVGHWDVDEGEYLTMLTLTPLLHDLTPTAGRLRMTEAQCVAFFFLFKTYYNTFLHMEGMAYLPVAMCEDIHKHFIANKNIHIDL